MDWRLGVHDAHAPTSYGGTYWNDHANVVSTLLVVLGCVLIVMPLAILGMALSWIVWRMARPTWLTAAVMAVAGVLCVLVFNGHVAWLWPWGLLVPDRLFGILPVASTTMSPDVLWATLGVEASAGPLLLLVFDGVLFARERTLTGGLRSQAERQRAQAARNPHPAQSPQYASGMAPVAIADAGHPPGGIRLGVEKDNKRRAFDLTMQELALHTFLPGASGSGKTTTLERLADGAMENGCGIVVVDCKGGSLGVTAKRLADRHGMPFCVVDPNDPATVGYEPCTGSPSDIANKIIGSFNYGEGGEIYKQVAMHAVPLIVRGLVASGQPVTLATIANACDLNRLRILASKVETGGDEPWRTVLADELSTLLDDNDAAGKNGVLSLKHRFGAILQGEFGPLFTPGRPFLDWDAVLATPTVVYISLPVTAASEDVDLMGRVLIQDIKQACSRRLRAVAQHPDVPLVPTLVAIDEFAALKDAKQIVDLLLQARQAALPLVLATQYFPQDPDLAKAVLQSGLIIVHRLVAKDSEDMAAQFGTKSEWKVTYQTDWQEGTTQKGSIRDVQGYVVHPNVLRTLPQGVAAVRSVVSDRTETVAIFPVT
jgi:hypothetical protein